jgi:urease accessory protein
MYRAALHRPAGRWPDEEAAGVLVLEFDARHRRRIRLQTLQGEEILLDLPRAVAIAGGDGLQLEDGRWLKVQAALEVVVEVRHLDPNQLPRLAWHLGNRHLPTEIGNEVLRVRPDHVIEEMLRDLGADLRTTHSSFQPEGGAYDRRGHRGTSDDGGHHHDGPTVLLAPISTSETTKLAFADIPRWFLQLFARARMGCRSRTRIQPRADSGECGQ